MAAAPIAAATPVAAARVFVAAGPMGAAAAAVFVGAIVISIAAARMTAAPLAAIVAAAASAGVAAGARIGIEIKNAALRRHPFDPVMRTALGIGPGLGVGEPAGMLGTNFGQDAVERAPRGHRPGECQNQREHAKVEPGTHRLI